MTGFISPQKNYKVGPRLMIETIEHGDVTFAIKNGDLIRFVDLYIYTIYIPKHSCHTNYSQVAKCTLLTPWYDACTEGWGGSQDFPATLQLPRENAQRTRNAGVKHAFSNIFHSLEGFFHVFSNVFPMFHPFSGYNWRVQRPTTAFHRGISIQKVVLLAEAYNKVRGCVVVG